MRANPSAARAALLRPSRTAAVARRSPPPARPPTPRASRRPRRRRIRDADPVVRILDEEVHDYPSLAHGPWGTSPSAGTRRRRTRTRRRSRRRSCSGTTISARNTIQPSSPRGTHQRGDAAPRERRPATLGILLPRRHPSATRTAGRPPISPSRASPRTPAKAVRWSATVRAGSGTRGGGATVMVTGIVTPPVGATGIHSS